MIDQRLENITALSRGSDHPLWDWSGFCSSDGSVTSFDWHPRVFQTTTCPGTDTVSAPGAAFHWTRYISVPSFTDPSPYPQSPLSPSLHPSPFSPSIHHSGTSLPRSHQSPLYPPPARFISPICIHQLSFLPPRPRYRRETAPALMGGLSQTITVRAKGRAKPKRTEFN